MSPAYTEKIIAARPSKKLDDLFKDFIKPEVLEETKKILPIRYTAARVMVKKAGALVEVHLRPNGLRPCAATYARPRPYFPASAI